MGLLLSGCGGGSAPAAGSSPAGVQVRAISSSDTPVVASASASGQPSSAASAAAAEGSAAASQAAPSAAAAIRLGLLAPFSGLAAAFGQEMLKGGQMALDEVNGTGGIGGRRVVFDQADDKSDPKSAPASAQKLVADGVSIVIGPATSGVALAAEGTLNAAKLPTISPTANDPRITEQGLPFVFRASGRWDQEPAALADVLLKQPRVALVADGSDYGQTLAAAVRQTLAQHNLKPVADEHVDVGARDFGPLLAKIKAQSPGTVFYAGFAADGGALAKALRAANVQAQIVMGDAAEDQALIGSGGTAVDGLVFAYPPDPKQIRSAAAVADAYKRRYGTAASLYALSTYDSVRLALDALRRAAGGDGETVRRELASTTGFNGVYWGHMSFDSKGDLRGPTYVPWTVRSGRFEALSAAQ